MESCVVCDKTFGRCTKIVTCDDCRRGTHIKCGTNVTSVQFNMSKQRKCNLNFKCVYCRIKKIGDSVNIRQVEGEEIESFPKVGDILGIKVEGIFTKDEIAKTSENNLSVEDSSSDKKDDPEIDRQYVDEDFPEYVVISRGSQRGKDILVDLRGFSFSAERSNVSGDTRYWTCSKRLRTERCKARVIEKSDVFTMTIQHTCTPDQSILMKSKVKMCLKRMGSKQPHLSGRRIVCDMLKGDGDINLEELPKLATMIRYVNRIQQKSRPHQPKALGFERINS